MRFAWVRPAPPVGQVALALKVDGLSPFRWSYSPDDETLAGQVLRLEPDPWGEPASDGGIRLDEIAAEMLQVHDERESERDAQWDATVNGWTHG